MSGERAAQRRVRFGGWPGKVLLLLLVGGKVRLAGGKGRSGAGGGEPQEGSLTTHSQPGGSQDEDQPERLTCCAWRGDAQEEDAQDGGRCSASLLLPGGGREEVAVKLGCGT